MSKEKDDRDQRLALAIAVAQEAGTIAMRHFQGADLGLELKLDKSIVTKADRAAEKLIRDRIIAKFPNDAIVGEEHGVKDGTSGWTWFLDPIDGTQAYARGVPLFGTLVAAQRNGREEVGVIFLPALGEMVSASSGSGTWWTRGLMLDAQSRWHSPHQPVRARVSLEKDLKKAMWCTTWMQSFTDVGRVDAFTKMTDKCGVFRGWGDCYGYALVATGRAEVMIDPVMAVWDSGPMVVILEEAGGKFTTWKGAPDIKGGSGVATNGVLHDAVLSVLNV